MKILKSRWPLVGCLFLVSAAVAYACPFCTMQGQTLTMEANQAAMVVYGNLTNARLNPDPSSIDGGSTDCEITEIVKDHKYLEGKKKITLPRYIPVDKNSNVRFLVFCDFFKDRLDPYRGLPVKDDSIVRYLKGAIENKDKDVATKLAFFFSFLDSDDMEVSTDAYKEFANADAEAVIKMVQNTDRIKMAEKLTSWLKDSDTAPYRYGLYGYLLGMCGSAKDGHALRELLDDPNRGLVSGIDGVLAGYISLRPTEGWSYLLSIINGKGDFTRRYAALRTIRHFWEYPSEEIPQSQLISAISLFLAQGDIADLAIEDLRKWKYWKLTDEILALSDLDSHNIPIIQRSILRYALSCEKEVKSAGEFVAKLRKEDPDRVRDTEELLRFELPVEQKTAQGE